MGIVSTGSDLTRRTGRVEIVDADTEGGDGAAEEVDAETDADADVDADADAIKEMSASVLLVLGPKERRIASSRRYCSSIRVSSR